MAVIQPIPKIPSPLVLSDMRPISILPILSLILERLVVSGLSEPLPSSIFHLHFLSPTNLLISATSSQPHVLWSRYCPMLQTFLSPAPHVFVILFDYSKAFDTLSHSCVASKLALMDLPDNIYNWFLNYLSDRTPLYSLQRCHICISIYQC